MNKRAFLKTISSATVGIFGALACPNRKAGANGRAKLPARATGVFDAKAPADTDVDYDEKYKEFVLDLAAYLRRKENPERMAEWLERAERMNTLPVLRV